MLTYSQEEMTVTFIAALLSNPKMMAENSGADITEFAYDMAHLVDEKFKNPEEFTKKYFSEEEAS